MKRKGPRKNFVDRPFILKLGARIREIRISKGMTIENLAIKCEVDSTQVGRMELGKVNFSVSYLSKIAAGLEVNPEDLIIR